MRGDLAKALVNFGGVKFASGPDRAPDGPMLAGCAAGMARSNVDPWAVATCRFCGASGRSADIQEAAGTSVEGSGPGGAVNGSSQPFEGPGWTLVEQFEQGGRRYVLAIDNRPACPGVERLSQREREIVRRAMLGQHDKAIASDLGLAQSTVRVYLKRAATKVGATSRNELFEKIDRLGDGPRRTGGRPAAVRLA